MHQSHFIWYRIATALLIAGLFTLSGTAAAGQRLVLADGDGAAMLVFETDRGGVSVRGPGGQPLLLGEEAGTDERDYRLPDGSALGSARGDGERFKLKRPDGALLWKVKRDGDRIKVSDNDQNADAAILRRRGAHKWELERDGESLGKIKQYPDTGKIKIKDYRNVTRHEIIDGPFTPAPLVLLLDPIPRDQAYAVLAEIWLRGW